MKQKKYFRYHRYDQNNVKYIKRFELDNLPTEIIETGYTVWTRGTGKLNEQAYNNLVTAVKKACLGVPKSQSCREKMSKSHLGKRKTQSHKDNIRLAHQKRKTTNETKKTLV